MSKSILSFTALFFLAASTLAASSEIGPHGGEVIANHDSKIEIKLTPSSRSFDVYLLNFKASQVSLMLSSKHQSGNPLELALSPTTGAVQAYRGEFPGTPESFVGIVLKVTLDGGDERAFRMSLPKNFRYR